MHSYASVAIGKYYVCASVVILSVYRHSVS